MPHRGKWNCHIPIQLLANNGDKLLGSQSHLGMDVSVAKTTGKIVPLIMETDRLSLMPTGLCFRQRYWNCSSNRAVHEAPLDLPTDSDEIEMKRYAFADARSSRFGRVLFSGKRK
jgi:hypothetical protein